MVQAFQHYRVRDQCLGAVLREVAMIRAIHNINCEVRHVYGKFNGEADTLSRVHMLKCRKYINTLESKECKRQKVTQQDFVVNFDL